MDKKKLIIYSKYNKKLLFSYLKYNYILKLIKYNKLWQNELDITKQNYETVSHYICYEKKIKEDRLSYKTINKIKEEYQNYFYYLLYFLFFIIYYFLQYILDSTFKNGFFKKIILGIYYVIGEEYLKFIINQYRINCKNERIIYLLIYFVINLIFIKVLVIIIDKIEFIVINDDNKLNLIPKVNKSFILYIIFYVIIIIFIYKKILFLFLLLFFIINCIYEYLILLKIQILKKLDKPNLSYHDYFILFIINFFLVYTFIFLIFFLFYPFQK